ncbi:hypothetical protein [Fodinicola acaciae]|uniref:hypothetical protein n=1 Tax=Fodinicola acaciae TaxID=2681555 RepID=UPI0013D7E66D|nr:hypothetical protein [Fodinicola acaciae]
MIRKMLVALALVAALVGAMAAPTAASAAPTTLAACSPHVSLQPPYSKFDGTEVWANWNVCFTTPGPWVVKLERKRWYGWEKLDSYSATLKAYVGYSASLSYHCDGQGTYTYRLNGRFDNAIGTYYYYSSETRFAC